MHHLKATDDFPALLTCADALTLPAPELRHQGELITGQKRAELLAAVRGGEQVDLEIDAITYVQKDGAQNRNFMRFKKGQLRSIAKSFRGQPVLRDHDRSLQARAGTIVGSIAATDEGGETRFEQRLKLTAPWAVEAALLGNVDRFSIGWSSSRESGHCTVCKIPMFGRGSSCPHWPGDVLEDGTIVELEFQTATGVETSSVTVPAVLGTGVRGVRELHESLAALAQTRQDALNPARGGADDKELSMRSIATALGLSADADEATILAAVNAQRAAQDALAAQLTERDNAIAQLRTRTQELENQLGTANELRQRLAADALCARYADRIPKARNDAGELVASQLEQEVRALAEHNVEAAERLLSALPKASPAGAEPQSLTAPRGAPAPKAGEPTEAELAEVARRTGRPLDVVKKYHPAFYNRRAG